MNIYFNQLHSDYKNLLLKYYTIKLLNNEIFNIKDDKILIMEKLNEFIYFPNLIKDKFYDISIENNLESSIENDDSNTLIDENNTINKISNNKYLNIDKKINISNESLFKEINSNILKILSFYYDMNNINIIKHNNYKFEIIDNLTNNSEYFYYNENSNPYSIQYYEVLYDNNLVKYDFAIFIQIGNFITFKKMEEYLYIFKSLEANIYIVIVKEEINDINLLYIKDLLPNCTIIQTINKGMDVGLFLINLLYIREKNLKFEYILKLHTKTDDRFRNNILTNLCKDIKKVKQCIQLLKEKNDLGMITGNQVFNYKNKRDFFNNHFYYLSYLTKYIYQNDLNYNFLEFAPGTFFYSKFDVFDMLNIINIRFIYDKLNDFNSLDINWYKIFYNLHKLNSDELIKHYKNNKQNYGNNLIMQYKTNCSGMRDFMLEHALERFLGYLCKYKNYKIIKI